MKEWELSKNNITTETVEMVYCTNPEKENPDDYNPEDALI